jgi:hypothetical protein
VAISFAQSKSSTSHQIIKQNRQHCVPRLPTILGKQWSGRDAAASSPLRPATLLPEEKVVVGTASARQTRDLSAHVLGQPCPPQPNNQSTPQLALRHLGLRDEWYTLGASPHARADLIDFGPTWASPTLHCGLRHHPSR